MRMVLKQSGVERSKTTDNDHDSNSPSSPPPSQTTYKPRQLEFALRQAHNPPPPSQTPSKPRQLRQAHNPPPPSQTPYKPRQLEFKLRQDHIPPSPSRPPGPINQGQRPNVNLPNRVQNDPVRSENDGLLAAAELSVGEINKAINNPDEFEKLIKEQQQLLASYNQPKQEPAPSVSHVFVELQQHFMNHFMGLLQQPQQPTGPPYQPRTVKPKVRPRWTGLGPSVPRGQPMGPPPSVRAMSLSEGARPSVRVEPERAPISPPLMAGSSFQALAGPTPVLSSTVPIKKRPIKALFQDFESKRND